MSNHGNQANQVHGLKEGRRVNGELPELKGGRQFEMNAATAHALVLGPRMYDFYPDDGEPIPEPGYVPQPQIATNLGIQTMNFEQQRAPQPAAQPDPVAELYAQRPGYAQEAGRLSVSATNSDSGAGYDVAALQGDQHAEFV